MMVVGFLAASMAYGRVGQINATLDRILDVMDHKPARFVARFDPSRHAGRFDSIRHRFHTGRDIAALVYAIRQMVDGWGSIENFFVSGTPDTSIDMGSRIERFSENALNLDYAHFLTPDGELSTGVRFTFPRPSGGSACKRLNMFLRWVVRPDDGLDLGVWPEVSTRGLIIPLDTHSARVSRALGFTRRATTDWRTAEEVTAALRRYDPDDPVRYDFALCHVSMSGDWPIVYE